MTDSPLMRRLEGRVAIVTGGAGGLGRATAERLAQEGAKVLVADINGSAAEKIATEIGNDASAIAFDACEAESIKQMIDTAVKRYGRLDILDNNVAATDLSGDGADTTVLDTSIETWDKSFAVNVRSFFIAIKYALPTMLAQGGGSIINIASGAALTSSGFFVAYGPSKAAVVSLSRYVATQYGKQGVRCNTICPGIIATEMLKAEAQATLKLALESLSVPAIGEPKHIAAMVAYLASDEAAYTNGATFSIDGGGSAGTMRQEKRRFKD
jgi:NAD(P)-dependent dehydrogenase (short-subunit alcohol dehydrogenase family)